MCSPDTQRWLWKRLLASVKCDQPTQHGLAFLVAHFTRAVQVKRGEICKEIPSGFCGSRRARRTACSLSRIFQRSIQHETKTLRRDAVEVLIGSQIQCNRVFAPACLPPRQLRDHELEYSLLEETDMSGMMTPFHLSSRHVNLRLTRAPSYKRKFERQGHPPISPLAERLQPLPLNLVTRLFQALQKQLTQRIGTQLARHGFAATEHELQSIRKELLRKPKTFEVQGERLLVLDEHPLQCENPKRRFASRCRPDSCDQVAWKKLIPGRELRNDDADNVLAVSGVVEEVAENEGFNEGLLFVEVVEVFASAGFDNQLASIHPVNVDLERLGIDFREVYGDCVARTPVVAVRDVSEESRCFADEVLAHEDELSVFVDSH